VIKDIEDLYKKDVNAASAPPASGQEGQAPGSPEAPAPQAAKAIMETPPGLPEAYVKANLQEQPIPQFLDQEAALAQSAAKPLNYRILPNAATLCHVDNIPYFPGREARLVTERVAQGPRVFLTQAAKEGFTKDFDGQKEETQKPKPPTLAHPDTLRPGTHIKGESAVYRPGA